MTNDNIWTDEKLCDRFCIPLQVIPKVAEPYSQIRDILATNSGRLYMGIWHSACGSAHCLAGWVIHLAGDDGYELEGRVGPDKAARMILLKSCPSTFYLPNFYCSGRTMHNTIEELAALEKGETLD
jgi:hypothetical protein